MAAWVEIRFETTEALQELHETLLWEAGAQAVSFLENGLDEIWEPAPEEQPLWTHATIIGLFSADENIEAILAQLSTALPADTTIEANPLEDKEWTREWMSQFKPVRFGQRLWVCPSWEQAPDDPNAVVIHLDPGIAFGTGTHPTTAMCLSVMDQLDFGNKQVIDYGCGSGILGIGALLLGAQKVWAIDHCKQALKSTLENAKRNALSEATISALLPAESPENLTADIVLANILAGPLITLSSQLLSYLQPKGQLVLSGLLAEQADAVISAYENGAKLLAKHQEEEWVCLHFERI